jgi:ABC-2 type transport system permease protein
MKKYFQIIKGTWAEHMEYRLNFVLWRVRMVMQLLVAYFLWSAIFTNKQQLFGYTQSMMLTYVLFVNVVRTIVGGTRTQDIGVMIQSGELSNYLIRPLNFFRFAISRDVGDKTLNALCAMGEFLLLFALFRPEFYLQSNVFIILASLIALSLSIIMFFEFSLLLSFLGFWTNEIWAPRFISFVLMEFLGGVLFPLDVLPKALFSFAQILPFGYFIYFPIKVYLGQLSSSDMIGGFSVSVFWVVFFWYLVHATWKRGLRVYTAVGK